MRWPQCLALSGAFWLALSLAPGGGPRLALGLGLGALFARLGWALLHLDRVVAEPAAILAPSAGYSLLFVPLGPLLLAPRRVGGKCLARHLACLPRALPPALALARVGCLLAGCCRGLPLASAEGLPARSISWLASHAPLPGLEPGRHPVALYEIAAWIALAASLHRLPARAALPGLLAGFGALRLGLEPWRAPPPLGEPWLAVELVCLVWLCTGVVAALHSSRVAEGS